MSERADGQSVGRTAGIKCGRIDGPFNSDAVLIYSA